MRPRPTTCLLLTMLLATAQGCSVKQVTRLATAGTLNEMQATQDEAQQVLEIGLTVQDFADDGDIDTAVLRALLVDAVDAAFGPDRRFYVLLLADEIVQAIADEISAGELLPAEILVVVRDAGVGVEQGATFYIAQTFPP